MRLRHATARTSIVFLLAAAAVSASGPPPAGATPGPAGGTAAAGAGAGQFQLTLVTGDRLVLRADAKGAVADDGRTPVLAAFPGKGRTGVRFIVRHDRGDTYVIPSDALGLIRAGRVDERLFNVSGLVRDGYDDRARGSVPVILAFDGSRRAALTTTKTTKNLPSVGGTAADVAKADAAAFWAQVAGPQTLAAGVRKVWLDAKVRTSLDRSVPQIGAPQAWAAGYTGAGTTVAVLDTGIDTTHPDLAGAVIGAQDFSGTGNTTDKVGHGTHVAGIVTGSGAASGGRYKGVAPDTKLLNGKVLDDFGGGYESGIIAGMEWAAGQGADVINMSLGGWPSAGDEPMDLAVNELTRTTGSLFVIAAGNRGPGAGSVSSPGSADAALTVGAVDRTDAIAGFSSRGPRVGDDALKPDLTAPGVGIVAPLAADSLIGDELPHVDDRYVALDGTSMATPHVAGAAAILAGQHPDWDADELKAALMATAKPTPGVSAYEQGTGRVDVARAIGQSLWSSPTSIGNGTVLWPHGDDAPITRDITYHNAGDAPVTLALAIESDAPAGLFTVSPAQLTVPAGGTATATLTTNTSVPAADRIYTGAVVATAGDTRVRTTTAVNREVESYEVDVTVLGSDGKPTPNYWMRFVDVAQPRAVVPYDASGRVTARVPKGTHYVDAWLQEGESPDDPLALFTEPSFVVNGPTSLTLDARTAKPTGATVDRADAATVTGSVVFDRVTDWGGTGSGFFGGLEHLRVAPSATAAPNDKFTYLVEAIYARPDGAGGFANSPYIYAVLWSQPGRVPADLVRAVHDNELAAVRTELAAEEPGELIAVNDSVTYRAPATVAQYYTPGVTWYRSMYGVTADDDLRWYETAPPRTFTLGTPVTERWNRAVYGVALADPGYVGGPAAGRLGNRLSLYLPLRSGQGVGHHGSRYGDPLKLTLSRDGEVVGEATDFWAEFPVPADAGTYRLTASTTSDTPLRTRVDAAWTFRSAHVDGDEPAFLPLLAPRFTPDVDQNNTAPAGKPFVVPVSVQRQEGGDYGRTRRVTVQVSYDDGATWRPAPVLGSGDQRTAVLVHPKGAKHVSLRGSVTDSRGNTAEITVIRAYALR